MKFTVLILLIALTSLSFDRLQAQDRQQEKVLAVIQTLFEGMREGDSSKVHAFFRPEARMHTSFSSVSGELVLKEGSLQDFLNAIGTPHAEPYDERISNTVIQIDGGIAQVWTDYSFYIGDKFSHCGVDAMQLVQENDGSWRILNLMDTRRKEGCKDAGTQEGN